MQEFFLRAIYPIAAALPAQPTRQQIATSIDRLVDLFDSLRSRRLRLLPDYGQSCLSLHSRMILKRYSPHGTLYPKSVLTLPLPPIASR